MAIPLSKLNRISAADDAGGKGMTEPEDTFDELCPTAKGYQAVVDNIR
jgi:hypothetical protein